MHRDIKGANILLTKRGQRIICLLGDFGVGREISTMTNLALTQTGTIFAMSPELIKNLPYGIGTDIWSLGVLLYEMCELERPFSGASNAEIEH